MSRRRLTWLTVLSVLPVLTVGVAVWAFADFLIHGSSAEFWVPPIRSDSDSLRAWAAAPLYLAIATAGFFAAVAISKGADRPRTVTAVSA